MAFSQLYGLSYVTTYIDKLPVCICFTTSCYSNKTICSKFFFYLAKEIKWCFTMKKELFYDNNVRDYLSSFIDSKDTFNSMAFYLKRNLKKNWIRYVLNNNYSYLLWPWLVTLCTIALQVNGKIKRSNLGPKVTWVENG